MEMEVDYLIIGAGAMGLAFADVILNESDATVAILDRRHAAGGHWNDAYPFVRLHQPSSSYGVSSKPLGQQRIESSGYNQGFYELATGTEVAAYFQDLVQNDFLSTGRATFFPMTEYQDNCRAVSTLSGETIDFEVKRRVVDASKLVTQTPSTHTRKYHVADGVTCVAPTLLPRLAPQFKRIVVLGAGKTGMDSVTWLLAQGYPADGITWVVPRDPWMLNRLNFQPGPDFFEAGIGGVARQYEIAAQASSVGQIAEEMGRDRIWLRCRTARLPRSNDIRSRTHSHAHRARYHPNGPRHCNRARPVIAGRRRSRDRWRSALRGLHGAGADKRSE